jgi:bifunctional UDP-N-acetylglucosamine pyrophosphorylase/glucosamine-1-phosphate N-acetyltransferase
VFIVKYKQEHLKDYFGDCYASLPIEYVEQTELKGTAAALMTAKDFVSEKFFVLQGDVYAPRSILFQMNEMNVEHVLSLTKVDDPENHAGIDYNGDGRVKRTFTSGPWVDRGIWLFSSVIFDYIEKINLFCQELRVLVAVQQMIDDGVDVFSHTSMKPWIQLGDHAPLESVLKALDFFLKRKGRNVSTYQSDSEIKHSSVEVEVVGSKIYNSLIFGCGMVIDSLIENSILYCRETISGKTIINKILVS